MLIHPDSSSLTKVPSPITSFECVKNYFIQRTGPAFEGIVAISNILKGYPDFAPYAFDVAMDMEKAGNKPIADKIRRIASGVIKTSISSPAIDDPHFLTSPLTGKHPVGVRSFYVEDASRNENDLGHDVNSPRRLELNVHYPALQNKEPSYRVDANVEEIAFPNPLKKEKFNNLWTRSQPGLEPSFDEQFPVVIFSHGWGQNHSEYQHIVEELASQGYCVITINHPFSNFVTSYMGHSQDLSQQDKFGTLGEIHQNQKIAEEVLINAKDIDFILHQIKTGQIEDFASLSKIMDFDAIGVVGHSMGGAAALQACRDTPAIKAGINIDGKIFQNQEKEDISLPPFLIINADGEEIDPAVTEKRKEWDEFQHQHPLSTKIDIPNATHRGFTMSPLFIARETGKADGSFEEITRTTNQTIRSFFDLHLKK